ncbi:hypothetical protein NKDENANG_04139 [Candidatus Entotheonellaceae bacterium PAL068K]
MKKLVLEKTAPFQGLPELVARDDGLFEAKGLEVEFVEREQNALQCGQISSIRVDRVMLSRISLLTVGVTPACPCVP